MPLYEYECPKHGTFEQIQKFSDPPLSKCPTCGGPVEKLMSAPAIQFKGTGWYITDYARKGDGGARKDGGSRDAGGGDKAAADAAKPSAPAASSDTKSGGSSSGSDKT